MRVPKYNNGDTIQALRDENSCIHIGSIGEIIQVDNGNMESVFYCVRFPDYGEHLSWWVYEKNIKLVDLKDSEEKALVKLDVFLKQYE